MHHDIEEIANLPDNWDGYDGMPMAQETLRNADCLLRALSDRYSVRTTPCSNGTVMLEWVWDGHEYTLEIGKTLISGMVEPEGKK